MTTPGPTITGSPVSGGSSRCSTDAKKASIGVEDGRLTRICSHRLGQAERRASRARNVGLRGRLRRYSSTATPARCRTRCRGSCAGRSSRDQSPFRPTSRLRHPRGGSTPPWGRAARRRRAQPCASPNQAQLHARRPTVNLRPSLGGACHCRGCEQLRYELRSQLEALEQRLWRNQLAPDRTAPSRSSATSTASKASGVTWPRGRAIRSRRGNGPGRGGGTSGTASRESSGCGPGRTCGRCFRCTPSGEVRSSSPVS